MTIKNSLAATALVSACFVVLSTTPAEAGKWRFEPRISAHVTFTDNVDLDDGTKQSDTVLRVQPGFFIASEGNRARFEANYDGSLLHFTGDGRTDWRNRLQSKLLVEPIERYLFITATAIMAEPFVDETSSVTFSEDNFSRNRRRVVSFGVSPFLRHRLGRIADVEWRYNLRHVRVQDPAPDDPTPRFIDNYTSHTGQLKVDSGDRFGRLRWDILARYETRQREGNVPNGEEVLVRGSMEYRILTWLGVVGSAGWQQIEDPDLSEFIDDFIWDVGLRLRPTRKTDITVTYGRENADKRVAVDASYERKRWRFRARYLNEISLTQRRFSRVVGDGSFDQDEIFTDPFGAIVDPDDAVFGFLNETFRSRRLQFDVIYTHRRTRADIQGYYEKRRFDTTMQETREFNIRSRISRELNDHFRISLDLRYRHTDFDIGPSRVDDFFGVRSSIIYELSQYITARLSYTFSTLDSNIAGVDRTENVVAGSVRAIF
ncbi:MAG: TIGR03016 family PEP-CTERM system-associated outer membrane protein [Alphaproteobacteria bacterium]